MTSEPVLQSAEMAAMVRMQRQLAAQQAAMAQQLREAQAAALAAQRAVQQVHSHRHIQPAQLTQYPLVCPQLKPTIATRKLSQTLRILNLLETMHVSLSGPPMPSRLLS